MGEKDKNCRYTLIVDDLIQDFSGSLVDDAEMKIGNGEKDNEFNLSISFDTDSLKDTFTWKILFGSNNWRKFHGFKMRRNKWLRKLNSCSANMQQ